MHTRIKDKKRAAEAAKAASAVKGGPPPDVGQHARLLARRGTLGLSPLSRLRAAVGTHVRARYHLDVVLLLRVWNGETRVDGNSDLRQHGHGVLCPWNPGGAGSGR